MGREIRRVKPGWEHPKNEQGHYKPLFAGSYEENYAEAYRYKYDSHPGRDECMPSLGEGEATAYQVYENVTEGTPCSPVLATEEAVLIWLMHDGSQMGIGGRTLKLTWAEAVNFLKDGRAPTMVCNASGLRSGLQKGGE